MIFDKDHDTKGIYEETHNLGFELLIPLNWMAKNDGEWTSGYTSTCMIEEGYTYDGFDKRYGGIHIARKA
ncbi:MAG: hypothetical protein ACLTXM_06460 [Enterococcus sp.]